MSGLRERLAALADEWGDEDDLIEHVGACQDFGCKTCVVAACASDLRAALAEEETPATPDDVETLADLLDAHRPIIGRFAHLNGVVGCSCMDRVFVARRENYSEHVAAVLADRLTGARREGRAEVALWATQRKAFMAASRERELALDRRTVPTLSSEFWRGHESALDDVIRVAAVDPTADSSIAIAGQPRCHCGKYPVSPEHCLTLFDRTDTAVERHAVGACEGGAR